MNARDRLALAADLPLQQAQELYRDVSPHIGWVKVGLSLFVEHGPQAVLPFLKMGAKVFLDLKLHDIPNTVELAAEKAGRLGVGLLTVHASGGEAMLKAALKGAAKGAEASGHAPPRILAVTVLTSMSDVELQTVGVHASANEQALKLARMAQSAGIRGLVCSAKEAQALRQALGSDMFLCTPGIRPQGSAAQDQTRIETPAAAIQAGSDLLVVGRPVYEAADPIAAAKALCSEVELAAQR